MSFNLDISTSITFSCPILNGVKGAFNPKGEFKAAVMGDTTRFLSFFFFFFESFDPEPLPLLFLSILYLC